MSPKYVLCAVAWIFSPAARKFPMAEGSDGAGAGAGVGIGVGVGAGVGAGGCGVETVTEVVTTLSVGLCDPGVAIMILAE